MSGYGKRSSCGIAHGALPTNGLAMLTKSMKANMGIMITASHNPYYDNGLKLFGPDGLKLSDKIEKKIENLIDKKIDKQLSKPRVLGRVKRLESGTKDYLKILVEQYIPGREIQAAIMGNSFLGAIELVPKGDFYDYNAKYSSKAKTKHIMPAPLSKKKYNEVLLLAKKAHKALGCRGITRSDFRFYKNKFYLL